MKLIITGLASAAAALASAQFSNDVLHLRGSINPATHAGALNGAPGSTLTVTNTFPTHVEFSDSNVDNATPPQYANQNNWNLSPNGTADSTFSSTASWSLSFNLNLSAFGTEGLNQEAGFWLNNSGGTDQPGQFIVKSDGELVQFGGNLPFHDFVLNGHSAGNPNNYQLGTTLFMSMIYNGTTGMMTSSVIYGNDTSSFTGAASFIGGYEVGGYELAVVDTANTNANGADAVFTNIVAAPEPASMAALALSAVALIRRRRNAKRS